MESFKVISNEVFLDEQMEQNEAEVKLSDADFYKKIAVLPKELQEEWRTKFEELEETTPDFIRGFTEFLTARKKALDTSLELRDDLSPELVQLIVETQDIINRTYGDPRYFLGNGAVAEVFEFPIGEGLCVKYVKNQDAYNEGNHFRTEFSFLEDLCNFSVDNIRTPVPYFLRIHPSDGHSFGMELIKGKSLSVILERPEQNHELINMVKGLDRDKIKKALSNYVRILHEKFKITHGDLFMRNLMVDEDGNFYIIDFGKAKTEQLGEDHELRREKDITLINSEIQKFFREIDKLTIK